MSPKRTSNLGDSGNSTLSKYGSMTPVERSSEDDYEPYCDNMDGFDMKQMRLIVSAYTAQDPNVALSQQSTPNAASQGTLKRCCLFILLPTLVGFLVGILLLTGYTSMEVWSRDADNVTWSSTSIGDNSGGTIRDFDYIVVGGGPAGIIAASRLAREIPTARIVLLESGSVSQASVLQSLAKQSQTMVSRTLKPFDSSAALVETGGVTMGGSATFGGALNKFDCPLLWSSVAGTEKRIQETFQLQPDPKTSTYWPIPLAMIARGLGGCGLHNAM
jgi:GMC oxidoreductase